MTAQEPNEDWWKALMREADQDIVPLDLTDRRILKAAASSARPPRSSRWLPSAIAASIALVAIGFAFGPHPGGETPGSEVIAADGGPRTTNADPSSTVRVALTFAPDSASLTPKIQVALDAAAAQVDLCASDTRAQLAIAGAAPLRAARGRAITDALDRIVGNRCRPQIHVVAAIDGQPTVLEVLRGARSRN